MTERINELAAYLGITPDEIEATNYDDCTLEAEGCEYLVLTDSEADERAKDYIKQSLWAFNSDFLAGETGLPVEVFTALQPLCEGANNAIEEIIGGNIDDFVEAAISADGRGHFMSSYDGEENQAGDMFIYHTN